jgi:hypothetical protein
MGVRDNASPPEREARSEKTKTKFVDLLVILVGKLSTYCTSFSFKCKHFGVAYLPMENLST